MTTPIACMLTAADLRDRRTAWLKLGRYVTASRLVPGGLSFTFGPAPGLNASLQDLVRLEAECCAWMNFTIEDLPDGIRMFVTSSSEDGERGVREAFAGLTSR